MCIKTKDSAMIKDLCEKDVFASLGKSSQSGFFSSSTLKRLNSYIDIWNRIFAEKYSTNIPLAYSNFRDTITSFLVVELAGKEGSRSYTKFIASYKSLAGEILDQINIFFDILQNAKALGREQEISDVSAILNVFISILL